MPDTGEDTTNKTPGQEGYKTPESQKELLQNIRRYVKPDIQAVATDLTKHKAFCNESFSSINDRFEEHKREIELNRTVFNRFTAHVETVTAQLTETASAHDSAIQSIESKLEKQEGITKQIISEQVNLHVKSEMEKRFADIEAIKKKFGKINFASHEQPTELDYYDFKVSFKRSERAVGFCPINRHDLMDIMTKSGVSLEDAFRVAVSDFLRLEMKFSTAFVENLEKFLVSYIWDRKNTLYIVVTDIVASGLKRIKQESFVLWENKQQGKQTRELRRLEVPQYRDLFRCIETYADSVRYTFKNENPNLHLAGKRRRTRILETDEYGYILQVKEWDSRIYITHEIPEEVKKSWPKINFKQKKHLQYDQQYYRPSARDQDGARTDKPKGRKRNENPDDSPPQRPGGNDIQEVVINPHHEFIPGLVKPTAPTAASAAPAQGLMSLEMASHQAGRTPPNEVPELNGGAGFTAPPNWASENAPANVKDYAEKMRVRQENLEKALKRKEDEANMLRQQLIDEQAAAQQKEKEHNDQLRAAENIANHAPQPLINFLEGSDTDEPITRKEHFLQPDDTFYNSQAERTVISRASTGPAPDEGANDQQRAGWVDSLTLEQRAEMVKRMGQPFGQRLLEESEQVTLPPSTGVEKEDGDQQNLRRPAIHDITGKVRVDNRRTGTVDDEDNNGNFVLPDQLLNKKHGQRVQFQSNQQPRKQEILHLLRKMILRRKTQLLSPKPKWKASPSASLKRRRIGP